MFPLMIIGGVIGAVATAVKGGAWLSDQISATQSSASVGGKPSPFEGALAAQAAGQTMPAGKAALPPTALVQPTHGTDYDALARMNAGIVAYNHVGEHHGKHDAAPTGLD
jgi:hypothetical protein